MLTTNEKLSYVLVEPAAQLPSVDEKEIINMMMKHSLVELSRKSMLFVNRGRVESQSFHGLLAGATKV